MDPKRLILLLCFFISTAYAQQIHLQGNITDAQTSKPIAGATIGMASKNFFYPADGNGQIDIMDNRLQVGDTISISCVGYLSQKLLVKDAGLQIDIKLQPYATVLNEVKVGYKKPQIIKVGSKVKSYFAITSILPGSEIAMFMQGSAHVKGIIQTAEFFLREGNIFVSDKGDATAPFRVKLYGVGPDGKPGKELINDVIIVSAKKKNEWFALDISRYQVDNPDSGFFVSFALLDPKFYQVSNKYKGMHTSSAEIKTPRLSMTEHEFKEVLSYRGYGRIQWTPARSNYLIRATIAADAP